MRLHRKFSFCPPPSNDFWDIYLAQNPAFLGAQNAIRTEFGASISNKTFEALLNAQIIYSQPNKILRLWGRVNIEVGGFVGFGVPKSLNLAMLGISQDGILPIWSDLAHSLYFGVGLGAYIKSKADSRVGSAFTFGERAFVGYAVGRFTLEIYVKHYSNGTLSVPNKGYNFAGIALGGLF